VTDKTLEEPAAPLSDLYSRQGFLLRRAHQIAVALFLEASESFNITSTQYAALYCLSEVEGLDQIGLARLLGIDRSTSALVVSKLEAAKWISRQVDADDRRRKVLVTTELGRQLLADMVPVIAGFRERLRTPFTAEEQDVFLALLTRFAKAFNDDIRTPILPL
jgi:DNA-binding MarR family transcriptional regulator